MKIHLYTLAWNEERILPHFFRHYTKFCERIVVFDNESTDATPDIIRACPQAEHRVWSSNNQVNDQMYLDIKNTAYHESRGTADWVIVCDADEFLYHPSLLDKLASYQRWGINLPRVKGFDMLPRTMPLDTDDLPLVHREGIPDKWMNKRVIFRPELDIRYNPGAHSIAKPAGARSSLMPSLKLLHYKMLSLPYYMQRHRMLGERLSELNRMNGWGQHYLYAPEQMTKEYEDAAARRRVVV